MTWPTDDLETTHFDSAADNPSLARPMLRRLFDRVKTMIAARGAPGGVCDLGRRCAGAGRALRAQRRGRGSRGSTPTRSSTPISSPTPSRTSGTAGGCGSGSSTGPGGGYVDLRAGDERRSLRTPAKDIPLGSGAWTGGLSDGTTLWFIHNQGNTYRARAYVAATRAPDPGKDIALTARSGWRAGVSDGTTLWFVNDAGARAYVAATRARDSAKDISFSGTTAGPAQSARSDGTTMWFIHSDRNNRVHKAEAYTAATRARDADKDIWLPNSGRALYRAGTSHGTVIWFVNADAVALAYTAALVSFL